MDENTFVVHNHFDKKYKKTQVQVSKTWDDDNNRDRIRPESLTVHLLADGEVIDTAELTEKNNWSYIFKDLYQNVNGSPIVYTVEEVIPAQYQGSIELVEDGPDNWLFKLLNKYLPKRTSYKATKVWDDQDNRWSKRPEAIAVQLLADGEAQGDPVILNADNNWTCTWKDLYVNNTEGKAIVYTAVEVEIPAGYTVTYEQKNGETVITNYYRKSGGGGGGGGGRSVGGGVPGSTPPVPEVPMGEPSLPGRLPKTGLPLSTALPFLAVALAAAGSLFGFRRRDKDDDEK